MAKSRSSRRRAERSSAKRSTQKPPPEGFPEENPTRPREYHGRRTMLAALGVVGAIALAVWLAVGSGGSARIEGSLGVTSLPGYLNAAGLREAPIEDALAPDFELETLDGERFRLSDLRGHPTIVNFWASWCGPCRQETPVLVRLSQMFRDAGLVVVGVNIEESRGAAQGFVSEFGMEYVVPMDFSGDVTAAYFGAGSGPPHTYFIRPDGTIERIFLGQGSDDAFEQLTAALAASLSEPIGPGPLPGPKAVPTDRLVEGRDVGGLIGNMAPDFLLMSATGSRWRLSDNNRLGPVLLALAPPGCADCAGRLSEAVAAADSAGVTVVVVAADGLGDGLNLVWRDDVGELFLASSSLELVLIGQDGVITARAESGAELQRALDSAGFVAAAAGTPTS